MDNNNIRNESFSEDVQLAVKRIRNYNKKRYLDISCIRLGYNALYIGVPSQDDFYRIDEHLTDVMTKTIERITDFRQVNRYGNGEIVMNVKKKEV